MITLYKCNKIMYVNQAPNSGMYAERVIFSLKTAMDASKNAGKVTDKNVF